MALLADESECPELLRSCDAVLASAAGFAAARLEALTGEPGAQNLVSSDSACDLRLPSSTPKIVDTHQGISAGVWANQ